MSAMVPNSVAGRLHVLMTQAAAVPSQDLNEIEHLIRAGELLLAFENLCTQMYEYAVVLSLSDLALVADLTSELRADQKYYAWLAEDASG